MSFEEKITHIRQVFPQLPLDQITTNLEGLVHEVIIVDRERVFRFPRGAWGHESLIQEMRVLKLLSGRVPVEIPTVDYQDEQMVSYRYLSGRPLLNRTLDLLEEKPRQVVAQQVAGFLRSMHGVPRAMIDHHQIGPSDTVRREDEWIELYDRVQEELFPYLMAHAREIIHAHFSPLVEDPRFMAYDPVLMNGDIGTYHLLYDETAGCLGGIIDFGTAGLGDPAADIACLLFQYGERFVRQVADYYPDLALLIDRARFWAGTLELQWALRGMGEMRRQNIDQDKKMDWSWFTVHIGLGARDIMPIGSPF